MQVHAQSEPTRATEHPMLTDSAATLIGLSPDQLQGWRDLGVQYQDELDELQKKRDSEEERRLWWKKRDDALRQFLTPEQYEKWIKLDRDVQGKFHSPAKQQIHG